MLASLSDDVRKSYTPRPLNDINRTTFSIPRRNGIRPPVHIVISSKQCCARLHPALLRPYLGVLKATLNLAPC
ncbi:MAG: hypothetical protein QG649_779 [Patescibacteria group bacterium]|nr:hypothetical protein [Patescibacteria group bacterium]